MGPWRTGIIDIQQIPKAVLIGAGLTRLERQHDTEFCILAMCVGFSHTKT
jgi:hypothetical protein